MPDIKKLLVIDDDFHGYDTPVALNRAIDELRQMGDRWAFYLHDQKRGFEACRNNHYNAVLIDNDFGDGMVTLARLIEDSALGMPVAYVTAYDVEGLVMQNIHILERQVMSCIDPNEFKKFGVTHIRKRGNNVSKELTVEDLKRDLVEFLKLVGS